MAARAPTRALAAKPKPRRVEGLRANAEAILVGVTGGELWIGYY